jgi:hypothetical protein
MLVLLLFGRLRVPSRLNINNNSYLKILILITIFKDLQILTATWKFRHFDITISQW